MKQQNTTSERNIQKSWYVCEIGREYFRIVICEGVPVEVFLRFEDEGLHEITLTNSNDNFKDEVKTCMNKLLKWDFEKFKSMCGEISKDSENVFFVMTQEIINDKLKEVRQYEKDLMSLLL